MTSKQKLIQDGSLRENDSQGEEGNDVSEDLSHEVDEVV